jgi:hypothetical protein
MPTIKIIDGVKINIYNGDHRPPHIHAVYNEFETLITIERGEVFAGDMPEKQLRKVVKWLETNSEWALSVFYELNSSLR